MEEQFEEGQNLEEGAEVTNRITDFLAKNPEIVADYNGSTFFRVAEEAENVTEITNSVKVSWSPEYIPAKSIYKELSGIAPEVMPPQNLKHLFLGEIELENGELILKGFHHARSYPERITEILIPPNKFGIYHARYVYKNIEKEATFFPDHWDRVTVLKKISEAYKNPIKFDEKCGILGKTSEGIEIRIWFKKNKPTGELTINSAYPTKDQLLKECSENN